LPFSAGFANAKLIDKWGFVDIDGKEVTPFKYDKVSYMHYGYAKVESDGKYGFIDKNGTEYWEE